MTPLQEKKLKRLAKALDNKEIGVLEVVDEVENELNLRIDQVAEQIPALRQAVDGEKGEKGDRGEKGDNGEDGRQGVDGKNGLDGQNGRDGAKGETGKAGLDGLDGQDGKDGFVDDATVAYLEAEQGKLFKSVAKINSEKSDGIGLVVRQLRAGRNISIDESNQEYPIVTNTNPKITVSDTAPTSPALNDIWIDTDAYTYRAVTTTYTIVATDYMLDCSGTFTITLPTAVGFTGEYIIKNSGTGILTIACDGSETIDGDTTVTTNEPDSVVVRSNGANWLII